DAAVFQEFHLGARPRPGRPWTSTPRVSKECSDHDRLLSRDRRSSCGRRKMPSRKSAATADRVLATLKLAGNRAFRTLAESPYCSVAAWRACPSPNSTVTLSSRPPCAHSSWNPGTSTCPLAGSTIASQRLLWSEYV